MNKPAILPQIRRLVEESGLSPHAVAAMAGVNYVNLWRLVQRKTEIYNIVEAELVYHALTGKAFSAPNVPLKRSLRKGRAA